MSWRLGDGDDYLPSVMTMSPRQRQAALTTHLTVSIGWVGALAAFLALAVAGLVVDDPSRVQASYIAMEVVAWYVITPLSIAALLSGLALSLGTPWGLFRHYWVTTKLLLTVVAAAVLYLKLAPISEVAAAAATAPLAATELLPVRQSLVAHALGGLVVLIAVTVLGVIKPRGLTRHGRRSGTETDRAETMPGWVKVLAALGVAVIALRLALHVLGHHAPGH